jgi:hypothetical protein
MIHRGVRHEAPSVAHVGSFERLRVPIGKDAHRYNTLNVARTVCFASHNIVAAQRLVDIAELVEPDPAAQEIFTKVPGDVFGTGCGRFIDDLGAVRMPWDQALLTSFDVAVAAGYSSIADLHAPLVVVPHGVGYNKLVSRRGGAGPTTRRDVYGLDPQRIVNDGRVVPARIVLSHDEQLELLAATCPPALEVAVVAGDPAYDRLLNSAPLRSFYRQALNVQEDQVLVVIASTWGSNSLYGGAPSLLLSLLTELPSSHYRVALLLHPAVWVAHGARKILAQLHECMARGLLLIPPTADWRSTLLAADTVIGDHGSVTLYATVLDRPILLVDVGTDDVIPSGPASALSNVAPRLDRAQGLHAQVAHARTVYRPGSFAQISARITSKPGEFADAMRGILYETMGLPTPIAPCVQAPLPVPVTTPIPLGYGKAAEKFGNSRTAAQDGQRWVRSVVDPHGLAQ